MHGAGPAIGHHGRDDHGPVGARDRGEESGPSPGVPALGGGAASVRALAAHPGLTATDSTGGMVENEALLADLRERTGLQVSRMEIKRLNLLRDTAEIRIYFPKPRRK